MESDILIRIKKQHDHAGMRSACAVTHHQHEFLHTSSTQQMAHRVSQYSDVLSTETCGAHAHARIHEQQLPISSRDFPIGPMPTKATPGTDDRLCRLH